MGIMKDLGTSYSMDQLIVPSQQDGVTMVISRYRDELGKVSKIALDVLPIVVAMSVGPTAGAVTTMAVSAGQTSKILYDYLTTPKSKAPLPKDQSLSTLSDSLTQLGQTALGTVKKIIQEEASREPDSSHIDTIVETSPKVAKNITKGKRQAVIETIAAKGLQQVISQTSQALLPQVVVNLYQTGQAVVSSAFKGALFVNNIIALQKTIQQFSDVSTIDKRADSAIKLLQETSKKATRMQKKQIKAAAEEIAADAQARKAAVRRGNTKKGYCTIL